MPKAGVVLPHKTLTSFLSAAAMCIMPVSPVSMPAAFCNTLPDWAKVSLPVRSITLFGCAFAKIAPSSDTSFPPRQTTG